MTQDEIIEMAIEARLPHYWESGDEIVYIERVKHFANLVAQHEREACLKIAESMSLTDANMNKTWRTGCRDVAEAIRARGQA